MITPLTLIEMKILWLRFSRSENRNQRLKWIAGIIIDESAKRFVSNNKLESETSSDYIKKAPCVGKML
jgi:hypothetical protein